MNRCIGERIDVIGWMNSSTETNIETNTLLYYHTYIHTSLWYLKIFGYLFNVYACAKTKHVQSL